MLWLCGQQVVWRTLRTPCLFWQLLCSPAIPLYNTRPDETCPAFLAGSDIQGLRRSACGITAATTHILSSSTVVPAYSPKSPAIPSRDEARETYAHSNFNSNQPETERLQKTKLRSMSGIMQPCLSSILVSASTCAPPIDDICQARLKQALQGQRCHFTHAGKVSLGRPCVFEELATRRRSAAPTLRQGCGRNNPCRAPGDKRKREALPNSAQRRSGPRVPRDWEVLIYETARRGHPHTP